MHHHHDLIVRNPILMGYLIGVTHVGLNGGVKEDISKQPLSLSVHYAITTSDVSIHREGTYNKINNVTHTWCLQFPHVFEPATSITQCFPFAAPISRAKSNQSLIQLEKNVSENASLGNTTRNAFHYYICLDVLGLCR